MMQRQGVLSYWETLKALDRRAASVRLKAVMEVTSVLARTAVLAGFFGEVLLAVMDDPIACAKMHGEWNRGIVGYWLDWKGRKRMRLDVQSYVHKLLDAWMEKRFGDDDGMFKELLARLALGL